MIDFAHQKFGNRSTASIPADAIAKPRVPYVCAVVKWFDGTKLTESMMVPMVLGAKGRKKHCDVKREKER